MIFIIKTLNIRTLPTNNYDLNHIIQRFVMETIDKLSNNEQALNLLPKFYHYHVLATKVINHLEKKCNEIITLINMQLI